MVRGAAQVGDAVLAQQRQDALDDAQRWRPPAALRAGMRRPPEVRPEQLVGGVEEVELHARSAAGRGHRGVQRRSASGTLDPRPAASRSPGQPRRCRAAAAAYAAPMMPDVFEEPGRHDAAPWSRPAAPLGPFLARRRRRDEQVRREVQLDARHVLVELARPALPAQLAPLARRAARRASRRPGRASRGARTRCWAPAAVDEQGAADARAEGQQQHRAGAGGRRRRRPPRGPPRPRR